MQTFPLLTVRSPAKWLFLVALLAIICAVELIFVKPLVVALWLCLSIIVILTLAFIFFDRRHAVRVELAADRLTVRGDIWGRSWPLATLIPSQARLADLTVERDLRPKWKLCGTAFPGYYSGFFRLYNKTNATVFLSAMDSVVIIPRHGDHPLLLSLGPDFLTALQSAAPAS